MKRVSLILAILALCLTSAVQAQFGEADAALIVLEQLEITEEPERALTHITNLDLSQASPRRRVELGLLAVDHAITLHRFELLPEYLTLAEDSLQELSPSPQAMARFLHLTLQQRADSFLNPGRARRELLSNLDRALVHLTDYQVSAEDGETWVCSRLFLGRAFAYWVRELVEHQVLLEGEVTEPIERLREKAEAIALDWATTKKATANLAMSHGYLNELVAIQGSLDTQDPLYPLLGQYRHLADIRAVAKQQNAEALVEESLGRVVARRNLHQVARIAEQATARTYTLEEAEQVKAALREAAEKTRDQGSLKLAAELFVTSFEASFPSRKPGWREAAREAFSTPPDFLKNFPDLSTRYFTARARLNLLDGDPTQAADDAGLAVEIYQDWFRKSGLSEEGLGAFRRRAKVAHELLMEARLRNDDPDGAFSAAADFQALESLTVLPVKGRTQVFGQITPRAISESLPADQALLLIFPGQTKLYSFLLTGDGLKPDLHEISSAELQDAVFATLAEVRRGSPAVESRKALYRTLLSRFDLTRIHRLEIAPSSFLSNVPWGMLLEADGQSLSQAHTVSVKLNLSKRSTSSARPLGLRALGNPDGSLPSAELEVEQIAGQFQTPKVATGAEATRSFVESFSEDVMHFATHGSVNFRKPHTSYLLLAGNDHLTAQEIAQRSWSSAELVVLSACNTGNSSLDFVGHRSLAGAFLKAGAHDVLATLWPVDDRATRVFMTYFYSALARGVSAQESVREAQLQMIQSEQFRDPYFWGGFILFES